MSSVDSSAPPSSGVIHVRHRHDTHFSVVGNHLAQHRTLSATAIGLAVHIQSLPDGAAVGIKALAARFPESEYRIAAALRELERAGYLQRSRLRTPGQRIVTRTTYFEHPGAPTTASAPAVQRRSRVSLVKAVRSPAADLLARLRLSDPRLTLSVRDIVSLCPAVTAWLERAVPPDQVLRTLSTALPAGPIHRPARLLAYRLAQWLPPEVPAAPPVVPLQECAECERPFRAAEPRVLPGLPLRAGRRLTYDRPRSPSATRGGYVRSQTGRLRPGVPASEPQAQPRRPRL
ncbi:helix-turn-helix domain-containing protein [Streptomyces albipurpureus]|uniref:Helix-turn-helix domain-containing protein n=1 Tax=Streptomyces albipurpureus TaxID=2897419 RepID=A0ABT0UMZ9_9ACTN|nr:helix-turn-helix domain-containing protein [Streptomyces sp. CWNU-1]MCM2389379.1 helix-turn-helix domain-containing protein [Streptomyces sp. CWNU-1]